MRSVWNKLKIVLIVLVVVLLVVLCIFTMDMGNYPNLASEYNSVGTERNTGTSAMKKLDFIATYIKATGNIQIAIDKGFGDLVKNMGPADDNSDDDDDSDNDDDNGEIGFVKSFTPEEWTEVLNKRNCKYFANGVGYQFVTIGGKTYLRELQTTPWSNVVSTGGAKVSKSGCWLFASVNAINNVTGSNLSVADFIEERKAGDKVTYDNNTNKWVANRNVKSLDGGADDAFFENHGVTKTKIKGDCSFKEARDLIASEGFNDCVYILYCHTEKTSGRGCHWQVCVGATASGLYIIDNENSPNITGPDVGGNICEHGHRQDVSVIYKISKK